MPQIIEDDILIQAIKDCEAVIEAEQIGRSEAWPTAATVAYWKNAETLRRFLAAPHEEEKP